MPQYPATIALSALNGTNGFTMAGLATGDRTGISVSSAGDVNGDGFEDFIVGAYTSSTAASTGGVAYVVFGKGTAFNSAFDLSTLDGTNGFRIDAAAAGDNAGTSVAAAGDINHDGFADIIVGAPLADVGANADAGSSYVIYGKSTFASGTVALATLAPPDGFTIVGLDPGDKAGTSVGGGGDFNGDGIADFLIGAPAANVADGESYVIFGNAGGFASSINPSTLTGTSGALPGVILAGGTGSGGGTSISFIGDINGDGRDDVIFGGPNITANTFGAAGSSYVVFGSNTFIGATILPGDLDGTKGFRIDGTAPLEQTGTSVASAGDINGDGVNDLIIGGPGTAVGKAYVVFGKSTGFASTLSLSSLTAADGFSISGLTNFDLFGTSVASAGDVNGDGFGDIIVGADGATVGANSAAGESYVIFGKASGFGTSFDLTTLDGTNGFRIQGGAATDHSGRSVASAGDINADGLDDLVIGAYRAGGGGVPGASYVVLGQLSMTAVNLTGTVASQTLVGSDLADTLNGLGGNDALWGHAGTDTLNGGTGADTMRGGDGADTYVVDNLGDKVIEKTGEGTDIVNSSVNFTLGANVDNLTLTGFLNINGTGNADANTLTGNIGKNILYGGGGTDTMIGGDGDDIMDGGAGVDSYVGGKGNDAYYVRNLGLDGRVEDNFTELAGQGTDGVNTSVTLNLNEARFANIENGYIVGTAITNLGGSAVNNVLIGNDAANSIYGLGGRDIMRGGLGVDKFVYLFNSDTGKTVSTRDLIQDFTHLTDKIDLSALDANGAVAGNGTFVFQAIKDTAFTGVAGQLHYLATGANTLIEGDFNGDSVADFQIELTGNIATLTGGVDIIL